MVRNMSRVYSDGSIESELSKEELIKAIIKEYNGCMTAQNAVDAVLEAFRVGWVRGERYALEQSKSKRA